MPNNCLRQFTCKRSNFSDIGFGKFCPTARFASWGSIRAGIFAIIDSICTPAFKKTIMLVFGMSSKKKVVRVCASRIITFMANTKSWFNGAVVDFPRKPMCCVAFTQTSYVAIPIMSRFAFPLPTTIGFNNLFPEVLYKRFMFHGKSINNTGNIVKKEK